MVAADLGCAAALGSIPVAYSLGVGNRLVRTMSVIATLSNVAASPRRTAQHDAAPAPH
jgi:hypothetical protein